MNSEPVTTPDPQAAQRVSLCGSAYSVEAVHRVAYALMATIDVRILATEPEIVCELHVLGKVSAADAELTFRREVTDHQLRLVIEERTSAYRDLILGLAFSRTGLQSG